MADVTPDELPADRDFDVQVAGIAALGEPIRRALYRYVVAQAGPVNRDQAAAGTGVARHVAKFHLDKLVDDGLLEVEYARPPGRGGPGAGRPAKLYRRSAQELAVSLPPREYELAGRLLARAVTDAQRGGIEVGEALGQAARETGLALGREARRQAGARPNRRALRAAAVGVLSSCGYEPRSADARHSDGDAGNASDSDRDSDGDEITLANCPFHALAREYTDLVCGMNLELMAGLVDGLGAAGLEARLEPVPGQCCVRLASSGRGRSPGS